MTSIQCVFEKWGMKIPEEDYYIEYLQKLTPDNFKYIDRYPFAVGEKYEQVDMFFQEVLKGTLQKKSFLSLELKYRNILTKLWLYNNVFVDSNIADIKIKNRKKMIDKEYRAFYPKIICEFEKSNFVNITEKNDLELLIQLAVRDVIDIAIYYEEYELLVVPSWSCLTAYFNDLNKVDLVERLLM